MQGNRPQQVTGMGRRWNRLKATLYTTFHWLNEVYGRVRGSDRRAPPLGPLAPLRTPLADATVGLLTSAGVHLVSQPPYDMANPDGDASFRVIPGDADPASLTITHDYYDHRAADRDVNCVFPWQRVRELADAGIVRAAAPRHVAFMGHIVGSQWTRLRRETAPRMAEVFVEDGVDVVVASPG